MPWFESPVWSGDNRHLIVHKGEYRLAFQPTFIWTVGKGLSAPIFNIDSQVWWAPDGTLMAEANDGEVRFFDSTTGERLSVIRDLPVGTGLPMGGGRILSVSGHYMVTMHGTYAGQALQYAAVTDMETGQVLFQQRVGIAHLAIQGDTLLWFEIGLHAKFIDLAGKTASVVHPIPYIYSALNTGRGWVLAIDGPFSDAARVVLYRLVPFTEYTLIVKPADNHNLNAKWSPDGRRFAVFGGNETTLSVWEIAER